MRELSGETEKSTMRINVLMHLSQKLTNQIEKLLYVYTF